LKSVLRIGLIAVPLIALLIVPAFIGGTEPRLLGLPPILWWILLWVVLSPVCLLGVERMREE
jgi:hypothetical protein